jgi:hypothetical protein
MCPCPFSHILLDPSQGDKCPYSGKFDLLLIISNIIFMILHSRIEALVIQFELVLRLDH